MTLKENIYYWDLSLKNEEPIEDEHYIFDEVIINEPNFIKKVKRLREIIIKYCSSINPEEKEKLFDDVYTIITETENIQHHEFIAFWKVLGTTYSAFESFTQDTKRKRLRELLNKYCDKRMKLYDTMNYSNITIQALYDKGASRRTGTASNKKIIEILDSNFENIYEAKSLDEFENNDISYFRLDTKTGKGVLDDFIEKHKIGKSMSEKSFNIAIKIVNQTFLIKSKHMKETGGTQNSKTIELINFIEFSEESGNIHYVTFIDGMFFNRFGNKLIAGKAKSQKNLIEKTLNKNKNNFFVNTKGLELIFKDLK